jgi:hypothetical protein
MLIVWIALCTLPMYVGITLKVSIILLDSELAIQDKVVWYVKILGYLFLFWYVEILDYMIDKDLWTIKWYLKFKT